MRIILLLFIFTAINVNAQYVAKTIYFNKKEREITDPAKAAYTITWEQENDHYYIRYKRLSDDKIIQQKSFSDEEMTVFDGKQFWIDENDPQNSYIEYYKNNEPVGEWLITKNHKNIRLNYDFELSYEIHSKKDKEKPAKEKTGDTFEVVESMPLFPGGNEALYKFIGSNIYYPSVAKDQNIEGAVYCQYVIDETGKVTDVVVVKGVHPILDKEAVRTVRLMPDWIPGTQKGKKVKVYFNIPIRFKLS